MNTTGRKAEQAESKIWTLMNTNMKRDERSLKWAKVNGYKYVECDDEGNIKGYGFSRQTLEYHNLSEYNVMTIRQYEKATKEEQQ